MGISQLGTVLCLALVVPVVSAQTPQQRPSEIRSSYTIQPEAWQIVLLANHARAQAGAGPLKWDAALAAAARRHCLRMAAEGVISHQYADEPEISERAAQAGAHFSVIEENVAIAPDPGSIHNAWMRSAGHRANLLNPRVDRVGVAVVAGRNGLFAVADYERGVQVLTQAQVEAAVTAMVSQSGVTILQDATLARTTCATGEGVPHPASGPRPRYVMRWQDADLTQLPGDLADSLASGKYHGASVGSCPTQNIEGSFTAYRLAVLLY
ncbi:MAG: CAP domain-containing protein [Terracidiphilus sp.]